MFEFIKDKFAAIEAETNEAVAEATKDLQAELAKAQARLTEIGTRRDKLTASRDKAKRDFDAQTAFKAGGQLIELEAEEIPAGHAIHEIVAQIQSIGSSHAAYAQQQKLALITELGAVYRKVQDEYYEVETWLRSNLQRTRADLERGKAEQGRIADAIKHMPQALQEVERKKAAYLA